ncbi:response regulator [Aquimarina sp. AD10]|uniref:helix-turn-helix domain-containing protein n=1 Tax=Aquimarina sp. AD10 TaxID=1714849 RepID=UPI000E4D0E40|nr:response regulator [Aquimarina sp. AD10]AXT62565.1 response regulator [Aquimarina sp. AD10]RKM97749.1 response regulator [Aquimarina sp. AD10]
MKIRKNNHILRWYRCFCIVFSIFFFDSIQGQSISRLDSINKPYRIDAYYYSGKTLINTKNFSEKRVKEFTLKTIKNPKSGIPYWSTFNIQVQKNLSINYITFYFPTVDKMMIYVPMINGTYQEFSIGLSNPRKEVLNLEETSSLFISTENIDFNAPFYCSSTLISILALNGFKEQAYVIGHRDKTLEVHPDYRHQILEKAYKNSWYMIMLGMIFISFVFVVVHYVFHRKIYFIPYSCYLFFLISNYMIRTPYIYNIYASVHYNLYLYLNLNVQILSSLSYMYFLKYFVDMKKNYPRLYPLYNKVILCSVIAAFLYNIMISIDPYHPVMGKFFRYVVSVISGVNFVIIFYMFFKRKLTHTAIVFVGSILLLLGYVYAIGVSNTFIMLPLIVIETVLFMGVVSYLDFKNFKKALESDKLREINELKSNISHELRTPLTLIKIPIDERLENQKISKTDRKDFEMIQRNSNRLLSLIDQLLEVSRSESVHRDLQIERGNALGLIKGLTESFAYHADQKQISYSIHIKKAKYVWFDHDILGKIAANLLSNAIKYTPQNGSIICEAKIQDDILYLSVKNTGEEISIEQINKIFQRYYQIDANKPGLGIGLAYVKELLDIHKGRITVESEEDDWTSFNVSLSVGKESFVESKSRDQRNSKNKALHLNYEYDDLLEKEKHHDHLGTKPILLIVEDNNDIRVVLVDIFRSNYNIKIARNGQEGIDLAIQYIPDLIISDVMMPIKDGIELTFELKNDVRTSHIPIILLTAKAGEEHELTGIETGADDYIIKPFNTKVLLSKVNNSIKHTQKLRRNYAEQSDVIPKKTHNEVDKKFWQRVDVILQKRLKDHAFSIEEFSVEIGMSRNHLYRKLMALTGLSPSKFIASKRLKEAAKLLKQPGLNISEIAYEVGFNNVSYFTKSFKEMYDYTPSEYAKKHS